MHRHAHPRSRLEMEQDVLLILLKRPMRQTEIMYRANLIWKYISAILPRLLERKLIIKENDFYRLTPEGFTVCAQIRDVRNMLGAPIPNPHN